MIKVDPKRCILCGVCENVAPHIFKQSKLGIEVDQVAAEKDYDYRTLAIEACPMNCIENA